MFRSIFITLFVLASASASFAGTPAENAVNALKNLVPAGNWVGVVPGTKTYCKVTVQNVGGPNLREIIPSFRMGGETTAPWNTYYFYDSRSNVNIPGQAVEASYFEVTASYVNTIVNFSEDAKKLTITSLNNPANYTSVQGLGPYQSTLTVTKGRNGGVAGIQTSEVKFDPTTNWTSTRSFSCSF